MNESPDKRSDLQQLLTVEQVAETLQLSTKQVRRLIEREEIPAYRLGRLIRVSTSGLSNFIESRSLNGKDRNRTTRIYNKS